MDATIEDVTRVSQRYRECGWVRPSHRSAFARSVNQVRMCAADAIGYQGYSTE